MLTIYAAIVLATGVLCKYKWKGPLYIERQLSPFLSLLTCAPHYEKPQAPIFCIYQLSEWNHYQKDALPNAEDGRCQEESDTR